MNRHSAIALGSALIWGMIEVFALLRSRWSHPRHPHQG